MPGKALVAGMWVSSLLDPLPAVFEALAGPNLSPPAPHPVPVALGAGLQTQYNRSTIETQTQHKKGSDDHIRFPHHRFRHYADPGQ